MQTERALKTTAQTQRVGLASLPALGVALLPKLTCPACWPAYAGLLSSVGIGFFNYTPYLLPLTAVFLLVAVVSLGFRAKLRRGYGPLVLGLLASAIVLIGKFGLDSNSLMYGGVAVLVIASMWNSWPSRVKPVNCPACQDLEEGPNNGQETNR